MCGPRAWDQRDLPAQTAFLPTGSGADGFPASRIAASFGGALARTHGPRKPCARRASEQYEAGVSQQRRRWARRLRSGSWAPHLQPRTR
eukprot:1137408-Heterocapsa_arctica.AAC.1